MPKIIVRSNNAQFVIDAPNGSNLREQLLANGLSPYGKISRHANCGGRGLCASCGVYAVQGVADPTHWHDQLAARFRYPRLSCQITVDSDITIELLDDKWIWGKRQS